MKTALCVLAGLPRLHLHVNTRKDIDIALDGLRAALASLPVLRGEDKGRLRQDACAPGSEVEASSDDGWREDVEELRKVYAAWRAEDGSEQGLRLGELVEAVETFLAAAPLPPPPSINKGLGDKGSVGSARASPSPTADSVSRETGEGR